MQLAPRYLVNNRTTIIADVAGFVTEYRPVYSRQLKVYKGIDNVLEFRVLNADQKPVNISSYTPKFQAFDENKNLIIEHDGVLITGDDSAASRGLFKVTITDNDLLNIKQQYVSYNIHLVDNTSLEPVITYSSSYFENNGIIYVSSEAFPGPKATGSVSTFNEVSENTPYWISSTINAEPGINGNEALHTAVIYTSSYVGDVVVQATLDNTITESSNWADITTVSFDGSETEPKPVNFNGVFSFLRFKATANPADKITKIFVRN
jgi:hypothetical protein